MMNGSHKKHIWAMTLCLGLAACGGGGGSTPPATVIDIPTGTPDRETPDPSVVASYQTDEYNTTWGLDAVNAAEAYALGYTGESVLVAAIDYNFNFSADDVDYNGASRGPDPDMNAIYEAQIGEPATDTPHGHAVAATIAGLKDDLGIHGVAFNAQIIGVDYFSGVYRSQFNSGGITYTVSDPWAYAFDQGARIFNKSLGYDEGDIIDNPPPVSERYVLEYDTRVVELGGLLVSSAGNNGDPEPSLSNLDALERLAGMGLLNNGSGAMIIVGSVDENLNLSSFSDAAGAGESRFHFMVAPGEDLVFPWTNGLAVGSGTSFSAPYVSGAAAIILSRWPTLTGREVADILFESATDLGAAGVDAVYGHGLLNIEEALQPIGAAKLAVASGKIRPVSKSAIRLGPAFGDVAGMEKSLESVMILDAFDRDFQFDATSIIETSHAGVGLEARFDAHTNWRSAALPVSQSASLNYAVSTDKDSIPAFALAGQAEGDFQPETEAAFEFTGTYDDAAWMVGTGRSLTSALERTPFERSIGQQISLTGAGDTSLPLGAGAYFAFKRPLAENSEYWLGLSHSKERPEALTPLDDQQGERSTTAIMARMNLYNGPNLFGIEIGFMDETGSLLGSRSYGGLSLLNQAQTSWVGVHYSRQVGHGWEFSGKAKLALTQGGSVADSLITKVGDIVSSSFSFSAQKAELLSANDSLRLTLHQPLLVEHAEATLALGQSLDPETGAVNFTETVASLAPSGREVAVEAAYQLTMRGWNIQANAAFRQDAGHYQGITDTLMALTFSKRF